MRGLICFRWGILGKLLPDFECAMLLLLFFFLIFVEVFHFPLGDLEKYVAMMVIRILDAYDWSCNFLYKIRFVFLVFCNVDRCACQVFRSLGF